MGFLRALAVGFGVLLGSLAFVAVLFLLAASPLGVFWGGAVWLVLLIVIMAFFLRDSF